MAEDIEPTPGQRAAHEKKMKDLMDVVSNKTQLNAPRGMGTVENDPTKKPPRRVINSETEQGAINLKKQSILSESAKKLDEPIKPFDIEKNVNKPVRRIQVENVPPELLAQPSGLKTLPPTAPKSVVTNKSLSLPGASNGVFLLGGTLAIVALWSNVVNPMLDIGWFGHTATKKVTMPNSGIISLILFILLITFISTLSPEFANVAFLFVLGLWAVYLIMNPTVVQNIAGYVSQGNKQQESSKSDSASGNDGATRNGPH